MSTETERTMQSSGIAPVLLPDMTTLSIIGHRSQTTHLAAHPPHPNMQGASTGKNFFLLLICFLKYLHIFIC